nr:MAK10-like protein [Tanacetum cinerariifolium]
LSTSIHFFSIKLERPKGFAKPIKAISLPQDFSSKSDHRLIELKNQVQRLMEAHLALTQPTQVNKITSSKAYIDLNSPLNIMIRMMYNWIMRRKVDPRENSNRRVSNFTGRIMGMHVFVGNFTYDTDFMIVEDISSIIDPRLSQVVLGKPFIEISSMTHDPPEGVVRFTNETDEIAYKMPHKIK